VQGRVEASASAVDFAIGGRLASDAGLKGVRFETDNVFSLAEMQRLLADEWQVARAKCASVAAGTAVSISPVASRSRIALPDRPLIQMHLSGDVLDGDRRCSPAELPWENDSIQFLIVRHLTDCLSAASGFEEELARVLAPGGSLLLFGLNPLSTWRFWWARHARGGLRMSRSATSMTMRRVLEQAGLEAAQQEYMGGAWPSSTRSSPSIMRRGASWHGAWLLVAEKRRVGMRPIRIAEPANRISLNPSLAQATSRRANA
jgi:hypothetical protein